MRYGKYVETKLFISKRSTNFLITIFYRSYILYLLMKNVIQNKNIWFPKKTIRDTKKMLEIKLLNSKGYTNSLQTIF